MSTKVALDVTPLLGEPTGVGTSTKSLFDALAQRRDIELSAFAMSTRGYRELDTILAATMKRNKRPMPAAVLQKLWAHSPRLGIERWLGPVDLVHATNFVVPPTKGAALVTVHDLTAVRFPQMCERHTLAYPDLIKAAVKRGAHVHTYSKFVANEVHEFLGVDESVIHVVPSALEDAGEAVKPIDSGPRYVLAIGTVEPRKNYPALVRSFDLIAAKHRDVNLIIAGGRGWAFEELQAAIAGAKNRKQIRYVGRVSATERDKLLRGAAALVYPSIYEGFGLPPLEAMRAGVPVVAANTGALPEVLGDAALLVDPTDEQALAEAIHSVLNDDPLHARLVADGATREQMYNWKKSADHFVELYKELAS